MNEQMWLFIECVFKVLSFLLEDVLGDKCYASPKGSWVQSCDKKDLAANVAQA